MLRVLGQHGKDLGPTRSAARDVDHKVNHTCRTFTKKLIQKSYPLHDHNIFPATLCTVQRSWKNILIMQWIAHLYILLGNSVVIRPNNTMGSFLSSKQQLELPNVPHEDVPGTLVILKTAFTLYFHNTFYYTVIVHLFTA